MSSTRSSRSEKSSSQVEVPIKGGAEKTEHRISTVSKDGLKNDTELIQRTDTEALTTDNETLVHFLKCNVGTGILAMPEAFMNAGLWVGLVGIPIIGAICVHCMFSLVHSSTELCKKKNVAGLSYEETAGAAFEFGPKPLRKLSKFMPYVIKTFLIITQMGFCCVYFVFIPQNMKQAIDCMGETTTGISNLGFMAITIIPILLMTYIPNFKYLAPLSLVAAVTQCLGIVFILYYSVRDLPQVAEKVPAFGSWATMPLYFGSAIYAFEGIGLVLPLRNNMKHPQDILGRSGVLATATIGVICLYAAVGFFGYLSFGNEVLGSISLNLPPREGLAQAVKITMSLALLPTYPLQIYVVIEMIKPVIDRHLHNEKKRVIADYVCRTVLVMVTFLLAAAIPNIGLFISLVGALSSSTLSLVFPPLIEVMTHWPEKGKYNWRLIKCILIGLFGFLGFATGTFTSIKAIVEYFISGEGEAEFVC